MDAPVAVIYTDEYMDHDTGGPVECPERAAAIRDALRDSDFADRLQWLDPPAATVDDLTLIHSAAYVDFVRHACARTSGRASLNPDTVVSNRSYDVALLAAGGVCLAIDTVLDKKAEHFFAVVRPPGHHAEYDESLGFCLFNNIAIGARHAIERRGLERVFIFDWDVHHGNGTQHSLDEDPRVFFTSLHQSPHYPGTGGATEQGRGAGLGYTLNFPMRSGAGDDDYLHLMRRVVMPAIEKFRPQLVLVSAGFDAHAEDPLSGINLTEDGFAGMAACLLEAAGPGVPVGLVLEGGYNLGALARSADAACGVLAGETCDVPKHFAPSAFAQQLENRHLAEHPFFEQI